MSGTDSLSPFGGVILRDGGTIIGPSSFARITMYTRRMTLAVVVALAAICAKHASAESVTDLKARFNYLSQHGNVQCSVQFEKLISSAPMDETRNPLALH